MNKGVIYLDKQSLDLYAEKMTTIPRLTFPAGVVSDLEIIDVAKLDQAIKAFIDTHKILPASVSIVISPNLTFVKDILDPKVKKPVAPPDPKNPVTTPIDTEDKDLPTIDDLKQAFLETVPFDEVTSISLPIQNGIKVVAANKTMYTYIKRAFEKYKFMIEAVSPLIIFGNTVLPIDQTITRRLLTKIDLVKQHNMLVTPLPPQGRKEGFVIVKPSENKEGNKRAFMMIGVLVLLFVVMGYMLYQMMNDPALKKKPKKEKTTVSAVVETSLTPSPVDTVASESAKVDFSDFTFQIISPTRNSSEAAQLRQALEEVNAEGVTVVTRATTTSRPTLSYSAELTPEEIDMLTTFSKTSLPDGVLREGEDLAADIVISLPKQ